MNVEKITINGLVFEILDSTNDLVNPFIIDHKNKVELTPLQLAVYDTLWGSQIHGRQDVAENCKQIFKEKWPEKHKELSIDNVEKAYSVYLKNKLLNTTFLKSDWRRGPW